MKNWLKVKEIFSDAMRQTLEERPHFLDSVCGGDKALRRELESLLISSDSATNFMETPAVVEIANASKTKTKHLRDGESFGH